MNNKTDEYIKLNPTQLHEKLEELAEDCDANVETIREVFNKNTTQDPEVMWDIQCDNSPGLRKVNLAVKKNFITLLTQIHKVGGSDIFYLDERGRRQINWEILILDIMDKYVFKTLEDTEELLVYNKGIYSDGCVVVKRYVEEQLSDEACLHAIREVIGHIQRRTYIPRSALNEDKRYIPVKNGLIDLETFTLEPFDTNKIYTFRVPITYNQNASYERTERFFKEVLQPEDIDTMQEIFGYTLYPQQPAHKLFWWIGAGRNGKTTTSELLLAMIGAENDAGVSLAQLDGKHRFSVARLFGKLINVIPEPETQTPLQTPTLKSASGGDVLHGELKGVQNVFPFWNFAKFIIYANDIPQIADTSYGFWARALVIDFPHEFVGEKAVKEYHEIILEADSLAGLLNWALIGLKRLRDNNWEFTENYTQDEAKTNMQRRAQPVKSFIDDWTEFDNHIEMPKSVVYEGFKLYCDIYNISILEEQSFIPQLKRYANVREHRTTILDGGRVRTWGGLRFKKDVVVVKPYIAGEEVGADEALDVERCNIDFKEVSLLAHLNCPTGPTCPPLLYTHHVGVKRVILENKDIYTIYISKCETPDQGGQGGQEIEKGTK